MKRNTLKSIYAACKPCAVYPISAFGGIVLFQPAKEDETSHDTDTDFVSAWEYDGERTDFRRTKLHYTAAGRAYIRKDNKRIYTEEFEPLEWGHSR